MKKSLTILLMVIFIIMSACTNIKSLDLNSVYVFEGNSNAGTYKLHPTELELSVDLPSFPNSLMAFQVNNPEITEQYADELAAKLGFSEKWPLSGGKRVAYSYTKGKQSLEISLEGGIRYSNSAMDNLSNFSLEIPEDKVCVNLAKDWLTSFGLYPSSVLRTDVKNGSSIIRMDPLTGKPGLPIFDSKVVNFITNINGYEGYTPGASVKVGDQGFIVDVSIIKIELNEIREISLKTPQTSIEILRSYLARLIPTSEETPECVYNVDGNRVTVNNISIKYMRTFKTNYLLPVYAFEGYAFRDQPQPERFTGLVDAVNHQTP